MSINRAIISGNLTKDVELRSTATGTSILNFSVAVNDRVKDPQTQEWKDKPNFIDCVMFGKRALSLSKMMRKGMKVVVDGRLSYSSWENEQGKKRSKIEVVANEVELPPKNASQSQQQPSYGDYQQQPNTYPQQQQYGPQNGYQQPTGYQYQPQYYDQDVSFG